MAGVLIFGGLGFVLWTVVVALIWSGKSAFRLLSIPLLTQGHLPLVSAPIYFLTTVLAAPAILRRSGRLLRSPLFLSLIVLFVSSLVALLWSPDASRGVRESLALLGFILVALSAANLSEDGCNPVRELMRFAGPLLLVQASSVVAFRVSVRIEEWYLRSGIAEFLLGGSASNIFTTEYNNVLLSYKSGGVLFVNANVASLFLGVAAMSCLGMKLTTTERRWLALAIICWVAIFFTGSKTGIILSAVVPLVVVLAYRLVDGRPHAAGFSGLILIAPILVVAVSILLSSTAGQVDSASGRIDDPGDSFEDRLKIWGGGLELFREHPLQGLGFGGWLEEFPKVMHFGDTLGGFPPHNLILLTWSNAGLVGAIALVWFFGLYFRASVGVLLRTSERSARKHQSIGLGVGLWVFVHGQADNTFLYGGLSILPFFGVYLGRLFYQYRMIRQRGSSERESILAT